MRNESPARYQNGQANPGDVNGATNPSPECGAARGAQKRAVVPGNENTSGVLRARPPSERLGIDVLDLNARLFDATAKLTTLKLGMEKATDQGVITIYYLMALAEAAWKYFVMFTMRR